MNQDNIFYNGNNWVIKEKINSDFLDRINFFIDKFCEDSSALKKDETNTKVLDLSTIGKLSNQYSIRKENISKDFLNILDDYMKICENICKDYGAIKEDKTFFWTAGWTVVGGRGGFHTVHDHMGQDGICSILYLKCSEELMSPFGETFFILSSECQNTNLVNFNKTVTIPPEEGNLILFPSYVLHGTYPQTSEMRQTLNLDFKVLTSNSSNSDNTKVKAKYS